MIKIIKNFLSIIPPVVPRHGEKEKKALRTKAVSQTSTGNVLVQFGRYATKEDIAIAKKMAFSSP